MDEAIERGEERHSIGNRAVGCLRVCLPACPREPDSECAEATLGELTGGLALRHRLDLGIPALRKVPEALSVSAADDRDQPAYVEDVEQDRDVAISVPAVGLCFMSSQRSRSSSETSYRPSRLQRRGAAQVRPSLSDRSGGIEPANRVEHARRRSVQQLSSHRDAASLVPRDEPHRRTRSSPTIRRKRSSARSRASSSAAERRTPCSRCTAFTRSVPSPRSDLRSTRPTIRSRQRNGST